LRQLEISVIELQTSVIDLKISVIPLQISAINCRYLQMRIKCENGLPYKRELQNIQNSTYC